MNVSVRYGRDDPSSCNTMMHLVRWDMEKKLLYRKNEDQSIWINPKVVGLPCSNVNVTTTNIMDSKKTKRIFKNISAKIIQQSMTVQ